MVEYPPLPFKPERKHYDSPSLVDGANQHYAAVWIIGEPILDAHLAKHGLHRIRPITETGVVTDPEMIFPLADSQTPAAQTLRDVHRREQASEIPAGTYQRITDRIEADAYFPRNNNRTL